MVEARKNPLKAALRDRKPIIGSFVTTASAAVAEVMALAGFDFLVVDTEHGPLSIETAENLLRGVEVGGAVPIVRVLENRPTSILRALDIGAFGVHVPMVNTADDARRAVEAAKYYPAGNRGMAMARSARYTAVQPSAYFARANEETMVIVHCENTEAVANLPEILKVEGIDVVFVGPMDLSQSLGAPGQFSLPKVQEVVNGALDTIIASGVTAGTHALSPAHARLMIKKGVRYVTLGLDFTFLLNACRNDLAEARRPEGD